MYQGYYMNELIKKLSNGKHCVLFEPRTDELSEIQERLNRGFVFVNFLETQGETELGIKVDPSLTQLSKADFKLGKGMLQLVGTCELDFTKVCVNAEIDLASRHGRGSLKVLN